MPANHCMPHTAAAKAKMSVSHSGKPSPRQRIPKDIDGVPNYRCGRCGDFFPRESFHKSNRTSLGIKTDCKVCHSTVSIASRDPVVARENKQRSEAVRRARKAGSNGRVTAADWRIVISILGDRCLCCGSVAQPTQDHIIPLSKGGEHHPANLQPLCRRCNERKQARSIDYRTDAQRVAVESVWVIEFKRVAA